MSGIAGIIAFDGMPVDHALLEKMTSSMAHRGPDGIHHWAKQSVALGHCMLCTTPESLEEHQPLTNEDESLALVMDGRVDNWQELRRELLENGVALRDRSDAELVLRSYQMWGQACLHHIDGDFALMIWDANKQTAFCARDRMGNKPFNYHWNGKIFVFASELHAILTLPWVSQVLNEGILAEFLAAEWYSKDETFWRGILRLVESHQMEISQDGLRLVKYWKPDFSQELPFKQDEEYIEYYLELFTDSVRRMSRSHRPVAFEVSGGLDSSAVFCLADQLRRLRQLPAPAIKGYTLAFLHDSNANELEYSRAVNEHLGVGICEVPPTEAPLSWYREWASFYQEFPGYPNGAMSLGLRQKAREHGSRVLLGGSGGDEWFGGDGQRWYYLEELMAGRWQNLLGCFKADCRDAGLATGIWWFLRFGLVPLLPATIQSSLRSVRRRFSRVGQDTRMEKGIWLTEALQHVLMKRREQALSNAPVSPHLGSRLRQRNLLADAYIPFAGELEERMASRLGLELRHPMRSPNMVQFAVSTPERLRMRGQTNKFIHVHAMKAVLPITVLTRKSKADFSILFRRNLEQMQIELKQIVKEGRPARIIPDRIDDLYNSYQERLGFDSSTGGGREQWILWNVFTCGGIILDIVGETI